MKIVARLSPKTSKVVVAEMTKPGTEAEKAKSKEEAPLPNGLLSPKHNIMYIEANHYTEKNRYHTQNTHYDCFLILITSGKKRAKATSQLDCIHRRAALQGTAKAQGYALCLPPEAHRAKQEHLDNCFTRVTRFPSQG